MMKAQKRQLHHLLVEDYKSKMMDISIYCEHGYYIFKNCSGVRKGRAAEVSKKQKRVS
jgi:hypothetical protein